jgi:P4 family phage/plasmid primase-like protien
MIGSETIDYLIGYLYDNIMPSLPNYNNTDIQPFGEGDSRPQKNSEAKLCDLFERYIYRTHSKIFQLSVSGVLHVFNGKYYEKVTKKTFLQEIIKKAMEKMDIGLVYQKLSNKFIANECLSGMENDPEAVFKPNRRYIVFDNGVLDLKEHKLKDFSIKYQTDIVLDFDYDPDYSMQLWNEKVVEIIPSEEMRLAFQMFCGALLVNRDEIKIEYMCFLLGPGSNGKSIIAKAISNVFGSELFTKFSPKQLFKNSDAMYNLAELDGKLANFTDDLKNEDFSGGDFKSFVSGEEFQARHPYGTCVFKVKAPMMLCCANEMPPTTDDSWGHHRRILPIYSTRHQFGDKDKDPMLSYKLSTVEARKAIFNWILQGYNELLTNDGNIKLGQEVIDAQRELRDDSNSARRWLRDFYYIKVEPTGKEDQRWKSLAQWREEYEKYCNENGYKTVGSKSLGKLFREKEFAEEHRNNGAWFCIGTAETAEEMGLYDGIKHDAHDLPF